MNNEHIKECLGYVNKQLRDLEFIKNSLEHTLNINEVDNNNVWDMNTGGIINESYHLSVDVEQRQADIISCFNEED